MNQGRYLVFDVGGTECKCGVMDQEGRLEGQILSFPAQAQDKADEILDLFAERILMLAACRSTEGEGAYQPNFAEDIQGIGMAFPGPFDYQKGISLMQDLGKYDHLYGISIPDGLRQRMPWLTDKPIVFLHDIEAFALGECWFGEAREEDKVFCLCMGTGAGSAFLKNHQVLKEASAQVPQNGWIYNLPYRDSILDDYLSVRGLAQISQGFYQKPLTGRELSERAKNQETDALRVWEQFGEDISQAILPILDRFLPNAIVLGGQISRSFCYFGQQLEDECRKRSIHVYQEPDTSLRAMQGLYAAMKKGEYIC